MLRMSVWESVFMGVALAMDAFAVSVCFAASREISVKNALLIAFFFGFFQFLMPAIGFFASEAAYDYIKDFDHWLAFGILMLIGIKMAWSSLTSDPTCPAVNRYSDPSNLGVLLTLSVATSIDALAVGVSIGCMETEILRPAAIIGITTFAISLAGCFLGVKLEKIFRGKAELLGGIILIGIAVKVLITG